MTTKLTDAEIAELERRDREATPGPWPEDYVYGAVRHIARNVDPECFTEERVFRWDRYKDAELIVAMRYALPSLLAEVRASRASPPQPDLRIHGAAHDLACVVSAFLADAPASVATEVLTRAVDAYNDAVDGAAGSSAPRPGPEPLPTNDAEACEQAWMRFCVRPSPPFKVENPDRDSLLFDAGFYRGAEWARAAATALDTDADPTPGPEGHADDPPRYTGRMGCRCDFPGCINEREIAERFCGLHREADPTRDFALAHAREEGRREAWEAVRSYRAPDEPSSVDWALGFASGVRALTQHVDRALSSRSGGGSRKDG